jgi:hypothetical protein
MRNTELGYRSFEDFERDELRRFEMPGASVDDMLDAIFGGETEASQGHGRYGRHQDEDEEDGE